MRDVSLGRDDSDGNGSFKWRRAEGQSLWIRISLAFLAFYFGEAVLFWQGLGLALPVFRIPLAFPLLYPLGYWGLFGFVVYRIQIRKLARNAQSVAERRFLRWQRGLMTLVITIGVVGSAFLVIKGSGSTTLGHVILFCAMFQAAAVIGAMELNIGWLAAAALWLLTALALDIYPATLHLVPHLKDEDLLIGLATASGFFLIGALPQYVDRDRLKMPDGSPME